MITRLKTVLQTAAFFTALFFVKVHSYAQTCSILANEQEICAGDSVYLSVVSDTLLPDTVLIQSFSMNMFQPFNHVSPILQNGTSYFLKVFGTVGFSGGVDSQDAGFQYNWFGSPLTPYAFPSTSQVWWYINGSNNFRPTPDTYNPNHVYYFPITGNGQAITITWTDNPYSDNSGQLNFELYRIDPPTVPFFSWSTGETTESITVSPSVSTTYTCTVISNGQSCSVDQLIIVHNLPDTLAGPDQTICKGGTAVLLATGASTYQWTNNVQNGVGFVPNATAEYVVTGTDAFGCQGIDTVLVTVNDATSSTQTQTALDAYTWPVNGQTYTQSGTYTATLTNAAGCDSIVTLNLTLSYTGIEELNPTATKQLVKITDLNGKETPFKKNTVLLFIYDDGTVERVFELD